VPRAELGLPPARSCACRTRGRRDCHRSTGNGWTDLRRATCGRSRTEGGGPSVRRDHTPVDHTGPPYGGRVRARRLRALCVGGKDQAWHHRRAGAMQPRLRSWMPAADLRTAPGTRASTHVRISAAAELGSFLRANSASSSASRLAKDRSFIALSRLPTRCACDSAGPDGARGCSVFVLAFHRNQTRQKVCASDTCPAGTGDRFCRSFAARRTI
jgi:hypothetical protein